ncbi:ATP-dependent DNA helicase chl1 [Aspergillus fumigatus]
MGSQLQNFNHPYSPYDIQLQFMRALYTCLEEGKVAVFESPTGKFSFTCRLVPATNHMLQARENL